MIVSSMNKVINQFVVKVDDPLVKNVFIKFLDKINKLLDSAEVLDTLDLNMASFVLNFEEENEIRINISKMRISNDELYLTLDGDFKILYNLLENVEFKDIKFKLSIPAPYYEEDSISNEIKTYQDNNIFVNGLYYRELVFNTDIDGVELLKDMLEY